MPRCLFAIIGFIVGNRRRVIEVQTEADRSHDEIRQANAQANRKPPRIPTFIHATIAVFVGNVCRTNADLPLQLEVFHQTEEKLRFKHRRSIEPIDIEVVLVVEQTTQILFQSDPKPAIDAVSKAKRKS